MSLLIVLVGLCSCSALPTLTVHSDDTVITRSCRVRIPAGQILADARGDGVLRVAASDVVIEFEPGTVLRGAAPQAAPNTYEGIGIRIEGQRNVTIRGGRINGFRAGIWATDAPGLLLEDVDGSDGRRMHLASDSELEDGADWLFPHENDDHQWLRQHGAAFYVERSDGVTVRRCRVWHGQNALCLDRVNDSQVYDNDFSFNSGWGIALWRSCRNVITRNACDFCIRGYSHGVYNRGQDSAGILMFEQDSDNAIAENSATHGGDGVFGWAGKEAMARSSVPTSAPGTPAPSSAPARIGNDRNWLMGNDFSYAAAHGIEMTFSFDNKFTSNRLVGNAICGIWGGYSQGTLIEGNEIAENGGAGYGLERGGVNIDSGRQNRIIQNRFRANACGVHLWWKEKQEGDLGAWAAGSLPDFEGNLIAGNEFRDDQLALHFRGPGKVTLGRNEFVHVGREIDASDAMTLVRDENAREGLPPVTMLIPGHTRPVGARASLAGRENIVMTEWGPWDHASPLVWPVNTVGGEQVYALRGFAQRPECTVDGVSGWRLEEAGADYTLTLALAEPGIHPYRFTVRSGEFVEDVRGALVVGEWQVACFRFFGDPVVDLQGWRAAGDGPDAQVVRVGRPNAPAVLDAVRAAERGRPHIASKDAPASGLVARTRLPIAAGRWEVVVVTWGGLRVRVGEQNVIEAWEPKQGPRRLQGSCTLGGDPVDIVIEQCGPRSLPPPIVRILSAE